MIRRLKKHFLKLFIAAVAITAALLFFALRSEFVAEKVYRYTLAYLEENLQSKVEMGRPKVAWIRGSWLINDVSIRPNFGKEKKEFLKAKRVRVSFFPWWNVFKREVGIRSIDVEDAAIYFRIEKGDVANLPNLDFLEGQEGLFKFTIRNVNILNGRMDMSYPETPMDMAFSGIQLRIRPDFRNEKYGFSLFESSANLKVDDFTQIISSLKGEFDVTPEYLKIKSAVLTAPEGKASTDAFDLNFDTVKWETKVSSTLNLAVIKRAIGSQDKEIGEIAEKINLKGEADLVATLKGDHNDFDVAGEIKTEEFELESSPVRKTSASFSARGKWDSIKESSLEMEVRSKTPLEIVNRYLDKSPRMTGLTEIHLKASIPAGPWSDSPQKLSIEGDATAPRIELAGVPVAKASARFKANLEKIDVTEASTDLLGGSLKGKANFGLKEPMIFNGSVKVSNIDLNELVRQWSAVGRRNVPAKAGGKVSGSIDLDGALSPTLESNVNAALEIQGLSLSNGDAFSTRMQKVSVSSRFSYGDRATRLSSLDIETPYSRISATGGILDRQMSLGFTVDSSDFMELGGHMGGSGTVRGRLSGDIGHPAIETTVEVGRATWKKYRADSIMGNLSYSDRTISSSGISISKGGSDASLNGKISFGGETPLIDASLDLKKGHIEDIISASDIDLDAKGDISISAGLKGPLKEPGGEITVKGTGIRVMGEDIGSLEISGGMEKGILLLKKGDLLKDGDRLSVRGSVNMEGNLDMTLSSSPVSIRNLPFLKKKGANIEGTLELEGRITGSIKDPSFNGKGVLSGIGYRQINLGNGTIDLYLANRTLTASGKVFGAEMKGDLAIAGGKPFNISLSVNDMALAPYFRGSANLEELTGAITGRMEAHGELDNLKDAVGRLSISKLQLIKEPFLLRGTRNIELELRDGKIHVNSFHLSGKGTVLDSSGWIGTDGETNLLVTGSVDLHIVQLFTRAIDKGAGIADLRLSITGKPARVEGNVSVKDGVIGFRKFDPVFREITGNIVLQGETLLVETVSGRVGEGRFKGGGTIEMAGLALKRTDISLDVGGLHLAYPKWLPSEVEGTLRLSGDYPALLISGDMNVVRARYSERVDWATFLPSFKQRFREPEAAKEGPGLLSMDINFKADRNLVFENNVGKGELRGEVKLKLESGRFGIVGQVEVMSGKVFYKEHEFTITSGVIEFPDPKKMEAVFDFIAEGKIRDYTVQILAQGNTNDFKVTMTSSPPLSELDIASLLSIGLTSKEFQERGGGAPAYGAASLLSRQVEGQFKDYIGFDKFHIDPYYSKVTGSTEPKLTVGKDVSDDVMVIYSRGLTGTGEQEVQMEYKLFRNFSVLGGWSSFGESRSGDLGADMKFRFEFR